MKLQRDKRNLKWTEAYRISLAKRLEAEKKVKESGVTKVKKKVSA